MRKNKRKTKKQTAYAIFRKESRVLKSQLDLRNKLTEVSLRIDQSRTEITDEFAFEMKAVLSKAIRLAKRFIEDAENLKYSY
jgi:uncharacterized membrane-anchored protein YhcB (DUF1043 family)